MHRLVSTIAPCCCSTPFPRLLKLRSPLSHCRLHSLLFSSTPLLRIYPLVSVSLSPSLMPRNKKKDRHQHWNDASDTQAAESITNLLGEMSVADSGHSVPAAHLQNAVFQHHSLMPSQEVWKPKAYGTVSGRNTDYISALGTQLEAETVKKDVASANEKQNATSSEHFTVDNSTYSEAQIRATFYPKFENEKSDQEIRLRMIEMVSKGLCTVEVSLKHSGSLFMYAGHYGGAYAKNSYGNIYTAVGVFVLGRIFKEAWGPEANNKQAEFSLFLERNRMCISMELVTAVLGDHGQRPREDYVVVTAVTELGNQKPRFYSTPEIIAFCRKWRLPTNHIWLFSTRKSVTSFFTAFDALCEEGTATPVCSALDEIADISIPGSKDHVKVQGEILEGLVARVVSRDSSKHMEEILRDYPPPQIEGAGFDLGPSVRDICAANRSSEEQQIKALLESVGSSFCPDAVDWFGKGSSESHSKNADKSVITKFLQSHPADFATKKLQEMIRLMKERRFPAAFKCYHNMHKLDSNSNDELYYKMVIHVHHDYVFQRYQKEMRKNPQLWPLYRGFFVDINLFKEKKERAAGIMKNGNGKGKLEHGNGSNPTSDANALADEDANLMIKLKFLTYKLRTFLIRNGLSILFKEGPAAYKVYYMRQMKNWGASSAKQKEMSKMLDEWAVYIRKKCGNTQLKSDIYLTEAELFLQQYAKRSATNQVLIGSAETSVRSEDFLAIVGGLDEEGDLARESRFASPSSPIPTAKDTIAKSEGLIVFFPGIPGCAKSALCKELLNNPDPIGDDRPIETLMGDLIKGKYWQKIAEERRKKPYSIMLADKNAPNEEVWRQIEDMCRKTKSSAVPVVPESEGTDSNPFSLDALAIFIFRVLQRINHPGNLDKSSPNAGYVLIMFYHLYEGKNRKEFEGDLIDRFGSLVKMPLLRSDRNPLPVVVESVLEEGINLYGLHTNRHGRLDSTKGTYAKEWTKWEKKLRDTLFCHAGYLNEIQVPFEVAVSKVLEQLKSISRGEYAAPSTERRKVGSIAYAAATLPVDEILSALSNMERSNSMVEAFVREKKLHETLKKAHVTLAHKGSHGVTAVAKYGQFVKQKVPVELTALLFSDKTAAVEAHIGSVEGQKVESKNEWPHVTIWTNGVAAKEANNLPHLHSQGNATRVEIQPPIVIQGEVDLF